jgi:hypothetical protein
MLHFATRRRHPSSSLHLHTHIIASSHLSHSTIARDSPSIYSEDPPLGSADQPRLETPSARTNSSTLSFSASTKLDTPGGVPRKVMIKVTNLTHQLMLTGTHSLAKHQLGYFGDAPPRAPPMPTLIVLSGRTEILKIVLHRGPTLGPHDPPRRGIMIKVTNLNLRLAHLLSSINSPTNFSHLLHPSTRDAHGGSRRAPTITTSVS